MKFWRKASGSLVGNCFRQVCSLRRVTIVITQSEQDREAPGKIHAGLLARNTALNLLGNVIPLAVGLITIPYVVRGLGSDGFGVLSIG